MPNLEERYDVLVVGSGATGQSVAYAAKDAGMHVAVVEERTLGGTCPNRGCDAKKVFVGGADVFEEVVRREGRGISARDLRLEWADLLRFKRSFTAPIHEATSARLEGREIEVVLGKARFVDPHRMDVGGRTLVGEHVVIATGSRPAPLPFEGADHLIDSDALMELERLPRRVCFVGGGYVSFEFAHVIARTGSEVTILHQDERPLEAYDEHVVAALVAVSREIGIDVRLGHRVVAVRDGRAGAWTVEARTNGGNGEENLVRVDCDLVVHGAGRAPNVESLDLGRAGIEAGDAGIPVDSHGRTLTAPHVYAGGDVADAGHPKLLRVASHHASVIAAHLRGESEPTMAGIVPAGVVFTAPRLAGVGLTERDARDRGHRVRVRTEPAKTWKLLREENARALAFKTIVDADTDRILGAFVLAPGADQLVNLVTLAMTADLEASALKKPLFGYPTLGGHVGSMIPD